MLRIHLFSNFTIKAPRALVAPAPLGLIIVKTLKNVLLQLHFLLLVTTISVKHIYGTLVNINLAISVQNVFY